MHAHKISPPTILNNWQSCVFVTKSTFFPPTCCHLFHIFLIHSLQGQIKIICRIGSSHWGYTSALRIGFHYMIIMSVPNCISVTARRCCHLTFTKLNSVWWRYAELGTSKRDCTVRSRVRHGEWTNSRYLQHVLPPSVDSGRSRLGSSVRHATDQRYYVGKKR